MSSTQRNLCARIRLKKSHLIKDGQGGFEEGWQDIEERWASVEPSLVKSVPRTLMSGMKAGTLEKMGALFCVVMRENPALPAFERFTWQGRLFQLLNDRAHPVGAGKVAFYATEINLQLCEE